MIKRSFLFLLSVALCAAQVRPPDTPAGKAFAAWLDSVNSGDRARLSAYIETYNPPGPGRNVDNMLRFRRITGGFDLVRIEKNESANVTALIKERDSDSIARVDLKISDGEKPQVTGLSVLLVPTPPDLGPARLTEKEAFTALENKAAERAAQDQFSGAILVARNGKLLLEKTYGLADREKKVAVGPETQFRIGSMNKMFTAVATLQLVEAGKLKLDDPVAAYLPDYPNQELAASVKVRHLLTHTGGTGDIFGPEYQKNRLHLRTLNDYVKLHGRRATQFEPGARWAYSNYGFLLLGVLIEKVSGQSYYDYVREQIFKPAGMTRTDSLPEEAAVAERSTGYMWRDDQWTTNRDTLPWRGTSAGGGYSTTGDLFRFAEALRSGKLIGEKLFEQATTRQEENYGFGFGLQARGDQHRRWGHGGGAPGMNGELRVYPDSGWVVVVLANLDPPAASRLAEYFTLRMPL